MEAEFPAESNGIVKQSIPLLPLRDVVVFPHTVIPLFIGRKSSVKAITQAMEADKNVFLATQKDETIEEPTNEELHKVGTLATILQLLKLPDGTIKVLVEGVKRGKIEEFVDLGEYTEVVLSDCTLSFDGDHFQIGMCLNHGRCLSGAIQSHFHGVRVGLCPVHSEAEPEWQTARAAGQVMRIVTGVPDAVIKHF